MSDSYELAKLDPNAFEHLVNSLAFRVLGPGVAVFGPGPDGGRDGYLEGEAPYPTEAERWSGVWYLQSKFHKPNLSSDPQKWLLEQIKKEIAAFESPEKRRRWPDNWIVATNIDPSGAAETGAFDQARAIVANARPALKGRFAIWGGKKILELLSQHEAVARQYLHFLTPGHVIASLYALLTDHRAEVQDIVRDLTCTQFTEQQHTRLEQAGSSADNRPGIHRLFSDIPIIAREHTYIGSAAESLVKAASQNLRLDPAMPNTSAWQYWRRHPSRSRSWFIKGGPGQGKSTLGQYFCQIQRAALMLEPDGPQLPYGQRSIANEIREIAEAADLWPSLARIPVFIELKEYAQWFGQQDPNVARGVLTYLAVRLAASIEKQVHTGTLLRAISSGPWVFIFDGLDEVPSDVKDAVATQVIKFNDDILIGNSCDALLICTSRPQGYSGQFDGIEAAQIELPHLSAQQAIKCATPVLQIGRTPSEFNSYLLTLQEAIASPSVREIMATPLQAHIMAVVVRDGGKPPERRWSLFTNFYLTIKKREANRNLPDKSLSKLLREGDKVLKSVHNRLGFQLHARAEKSEGAVTSLKRSELKALLESTVSELQDVDIQSTVETLMEATTDRLVLVSTPESGSSVRFDIRPLQEFFAAEFMYESVDSTRLAGRLRIVAADPHWREVLHFVLSALVENARQTDLTVAIEALTMIDDGDHESRALSRRLCRGGVLTARLLSEGVLEQDKRVRAQFRGSLELVFGSTDFGILTHLISTDRFQSRKWLINEQLDALRFRSYSENIGAAIVLCLILPDDHGGAIEATKYFESAPASYRACLMRSIARREQSVRLNDRRSSQLPVWALRHFVQSLRREDWHKLGGETISAALTLLQSAVQADGSLIDDYGIDPATAQLMRDLFAMANEPRSSEAEVQHIERRAIIASYYYILPSASNYTSWDSTRWAVLASGTGVMRAIYQLFYFASDPSQTRLEDLIKSVGGDFDILESLSTFFREILPFEPSKLGDAARRTGDFRSNDEMIAAIRLKYPGHFQSLMLADDSPESNSEWTALVEDLPDFAFSFLERPNFLGVAEATIQKFIESAKEADLASVVVRSFIRSPVRLIEMPEYWGRLMTLAPGLSVDLRQALKSAVSMLPLKYASETSHPSETFELNLPDEACLLPHIVNLIAGAAVGRFDDRGRLQNQEVGTRATRLISGYVPRVAELGRVIDDEAQKPLLRASACIAYLFHSDRVRSRDNAVRQTVADLYNPDFGSWYPKAAAVAMYQDIVNEHIHALRCMDKIVRSSSEDYAARMGLDPVLERWRQTSAAPVSAVGNSDLWK